MPSERAAASAGLSIFYAFQIVALLRSSAVGGPLSESAGVLTALTTGDWILSMSTGPSFGGRREERRGKGAVPFSFIPHKTELSTCHRS